MREVVRKVVSTSNKKTNKGRIYLPKEFIGNEVVVVESEDYDNLAKSIKRFSEFSKFLSLYSSSENNKMFSLINKKWNPVSGCNHGCIYCWARELAENKLKSSDRYKNGFTPCLNEEEFKKKQRPSDFVFITDMGDLFGYFIPDDWIEKVIDYTKHFKDTYFLFLTKNPMRYKEFLNDFSPSNTVLGCTIETNIDEGYNNISSAPLPSLRIKAMKNLDWDKKFVSIEPILKFNDSFAKEISEISPFLIYIGYDNYDNRLPEPNLSETQSLIEELINNNFIVLKKTLRRCWDESKKSTLYQVVT